MSHVSVNLSTHTVATLQILEFRYVYVCYTSDDTEIQIHVTESDASVVHTRLPGDKAMSNQAPRTERCCYPAQDCACFFFFSQPAVQKNRQWQWLSTKQLPFFPC